MNFGDNTQLVEEVVEFIREGSLMAGGSGSWNDVFVTRSFERAKRLASGDIRYGSWGWVDIRETEHGKLSLSMLDPSSEVFQLRVQLAGIETCIWNNLRHRLPDQYEDAIDDIDADLCAIAESRALIGKTNEFYEALFRAYISGGWPCGWKGQYPEGKMVVYCP